MLQSMHEDRNLLATQNSQILNIQGQIGTLLQELFDLQEARNTVHKRLQSYKYPVLSLPNEIVSEIFLHTIPDYPNRPPTVGNSSPFRLTHVCRKWREIAIATRRLWRAIELIEDDNVPVDEHGLLAAVWLERSGSLPLSIHTGHAGDWETSFSVLLPHRARWEYVNLYLDDSCNSLNKLSFPLLRSLRLSTDGEDRFNPFIAIRDAPLLRRVSLDHVDPHMLSLPWKQLTSLSVKYTCAYDWISILRKASQLVHCEFSFWDSDFDEIDPVEEFLLPRLETLEIDSDSGSAEQFIPSLVAPALRRLTLPEDDLGDNPIESLRSLITRSNCKIEDLRISCASKPEAVYCAEFPSIKRIITSKTRTGYLGQPEDPPSYFEDF
ncbi:F-box domain-containing protein [Favolaschia claudopus]|uniref:F-box domain-containing protein n=1 Tax=Favolaschia claudopus TaxID=2862362 RepID=A0AAW0BDF7_9AGAR